MPHKIMIIEDETALLEEYRKDIQKRGDVAVIGAGTLAEAKEVVDHHPDLAAVVVDGCFPVDVNGEAGSARDCPCSGEKFVIWLLSRDIPWKAPIIASSFVSELNQRMIVRGATKAVRKGHDVCDAVIEIVELLALTPAV